MVLSIYDQAEPSSSKMDVNPTIHEVEVEVDQDIVEGEPTQKKYRRGAVSAEAIKEDELDNYEKKVEILQCSLQTKYSIQFFELCFYPAIQAVLQVIPKDEATMNALKKSIANNVLFTHLDETESQDIFAAMFKTEFVSGEIIIQQGNIFIKITQKDYIFKTNTTIC